MERSGQDGHGIGQADQWTAGVIRMEERRSTDKTSTVGLYGSVACIGPTQILIKTNTTA